MAKELIAEGTPPGTLVVAAKQVAGRGRGGHRWASPRGGLYVSLILREALVRVPFLSMVAGVTVADALHRREVSATLKWPNDVLVNHAKVGGILVEGVAHRETYWAVVGIGINSDLRLEALPVALQEQATTLRHELGAAVDNEPLLEDLLAAFRENLPDPGAESPLVERYRALCETLGREVTVATPQGHVHGQAVDVSPAGALIVVTSHGQRQEITQGSLVP